MRSIRFFARRLSVGLLCMLGACANASPITATGVIVPSPVALSPGTPREVIELVSGLKSEVPARRDQSCEALTRLGLEPSRQQEIIGVLRAAATSPDPELRYRAREVLRKIDRSESIIPTTDRPDSPMSISMEAEGLRIRVRAWHRLFADGSSELEIEVNDGTRELFSGSTPAELADRVNEAARRRGYPKEHFELFEDGTLRIGGSRLNISQPPSEHLVREWGIWVSKASRSDGLTPPAVWGGWIVQARALSGKAFQIGIQLRDAILEVDGHSPETVGELAQLLSRAQEITLVRADPRRITIPAK